MQNAMPERILFVGIDVSKSKLDVALLPQKEGGKDPNKKGPHKVFNNTSQGHEQLLSWIRSHSLGRAGGQTGGQTGGQDSIEVHFCLEATGTYAESVAIALGEAGHTVSLVNPSLVNAFGKSELKRNKTDKSDAQLIARFCALQRPPAWLASAPELRELQAQVRRIEALQEMKQMEENRLASGVSCDVVRASLQDHIDYLQSQIEATNRQIKRHVEAHPALKEQTQLLQSIPGIGFVTAVALLAEIGDFSRYRGARQVAAFAGLVPRIWESGSSVKAKPRLSKLGSSRLRKCLYFPAVTALRCNPLLIAMGVRLAKQGKVTMLIIGAAMRKLLHIAYGVLKSKVPFNASFNTQTDIA